MDFFYIITLKQRPEFIRACAAQLLVANQVEVGHSDLIKITETLKYFSWIGQEWEWDFYNPSVGGERYESYVLNMNAPLVAEKESKHWYEFPLQNLLIDLIMNLHPS